MSTVLPTGDTGASSEVGWSFHRLWRMLQKAPLQKVIGGAGAAKGYRWSYQQSMAVLQNADDCAASRSLNATGGGPARGSSRCYDSINIYLQMFCGSATLVYFLCYNASGEVNEEG
jgi:molybdenum-dependent DNA-binding transcriptional regulator ModE